MTVGDLTKRARCAFMMVIGFCALGLAAQAAPVDVTTLGAIPNDGLNDYAAINLAIQQNPEVYIPAGTFHLGQTIYIPSNRTVTGAGIDQTRIEMLADAVVFRVDARVNVLVSGMTLNRPFNNSMEEMIFIYNGSSNVTIDSVKVTNARSRTPSILATVSYNITIKNCIVVDTQRHILEMSDNDTTLAMQVYGSAITCSVSDGLVIYGNDVYETRDLTTTSLKKAYYQAGAIQISSSRNALVACNRVDITGNGIDAGGATNVVIRGNVISNCYETGIKLVNGSNNQLVSDNTISSCGITAIWLAPGSTDRAIFDSIVDNNVISRSGRAIGDVGYWAGSFGGTMPAGVHLDTANAVANRSYNNTVTNNRFYMMQSAANTVIVRAGSASAINTTLSNNTSQAGEPPTPGSCPVAVPTPFPTPVPTPEPPQGVPGSVTNGLEDASDSLSALFDRNYTNRLLIGQSTFGSSTRWSFKVDLKQTTVVSSVALYGSYIYRNDEAAPGGLLQIEAGNSVNGPFTVVGQLNVGRTRSTNPFTGGKGKRIQINPPVTASFLRVSGGPWNNSFDNNVIISEMVINPKVVLHNYSPVHNPSTPLPNSASVPQQAVWNNGATIGDSRVGLDAMDGDLDTAPQQLMPVTYVLDLSPGAYARLDGLLLRPLTGNATLLPKAGTLRSSSTDSPLTFDTVALNYNNVADADGVRLLLPYRIHKRFLELTATSTQGGGSGSAIRIGEVELIGDDRPAPQSGANDRLWQIYN